MTRLLPALILAGAAALFAMPALAQDDSATTAPGGEKINTVIVYGNDPCPKSTGDEITVCARKDESERYRIPKPFRAPNPNNPANQSWTEHAKAFETVGDFGTNSCTPVGAGGATGCMTKLIDQAYAEKKQSSDVEFGKMIDEERQKRLSTIDAKAAAEQARVEAIEKQVEAKKAAEQDAKEAAEAKAKAAAGNPAPAPASSATPLSTPPSGD